MRTIPTKFGTDLAGGIKQTFYLFVVYGDTTLYWHTSDKTFSLWPGTAAVHGGDALTKTNARIAGAIDGNPFPLGAIKGSLQTQEGGGVGTIANMTLTLLNQDRFDTTVTSETLTNRRIDVRKGFVDTVNGVGINDTLLVKSFVIDSANDYDYQYITFTCIDSSFLRHRDIPTIAVEKELFPDAPKEAIGQRIPILYGDFLTGNDTTIITLNDVALKPYHFGKADVAPVIVLDRLAGIIGVCEIGPIKSLDALYSVPGEGIVGIVNVGTPFTGIPNIEGYVWTEYPREFEIDYYLLPITQGDAPYYPTVNDLQWKLAVDDDDTTFAEGGHDAGVAVGYLTGKIPLGSIGDGRLVNISGSTKFRGFIIWGASTNTGGNQMQVIYYFPNNPTGSEFAILGVLTSDPIAKRLDVADLVQGEGLRPQDCIGFEFGIRGTEASATQEFQIYHICVQVRLRMSR